MDISVTETLAAAIIRDQFPDLSHSSVHWLGEGYDSAAFKVGDEWVFRFPKRQEVEDQLELECRVLPAIAHGLPLPIPTFQFRGTPSPAYPFHFAGYPFIPGRPALRVDALTLPTGQLALLGEFFGRLHSISRGGRELEDVPVTEPEAVLWEFSEDALAGLPRIAAVGPADPIDTWFAYFRDGMPGPYAGSNLPLTHADFAAEHVLFDDGQAAITGIIDWSEMAFGDPALDLAGFIHWGGVRCYELAMAGYGIADVSLHLDRARYFAACRGVGDVVFGLERNRPEYVTAGLQALRLAIPD